MTRTRTPRRLPDLLPAGAALSTVKAARLPGVPPFLLLGAYHAGRVGVYAVPPGTHWTLNAPALSLPDAERQEQQHGAAFLRGTTLTLTAPGYRPAAVTVQAVRVLRECLEALELLEGQPPTRAPVPAFRRSA